MYRGDQTVFHKYAQSTIFGLRYMPALNGSLFLSQLSSQRWPQAKYHPRLAESHARPQLV